MEGSTFNPGRSHPRTWSRRRYIHTRLITTTTTSYMMPFRKPRPIRLCQTTRHRRRLPTIIIRQRRRSCSSTNTNSTTTIFTSTLTSWIVQTVAERQVLRIRQKFPTQRQWRLWPTCSVMWTEVARNASTRPIRAPTSFSFSSIVTWIRPMRISTEAVDSRYQTVQVNIYLLFFYFENVFSFKNERKKT